MGERYWITGVQLGMFVSSPDEISRRRLMEEIIDKQFITNVPTNKEKNSLKKAMQKIEGVLE